MNLGNTLFRGGVDESVTLYLPHFLSYFSVSGYFWHSLSLNLCKSLTVKLYFSNNRKQTLFFLIYFLRSFLLFFSVSKQTLLPNCVNSNLAFFTFLFLLNFPDIFTMFKSLKTLTLRHIQGRFDQHYPPSLLLNKNDLE